MQKEPIELKKRLEEVRLLESRRSARLADQDRDTDFARLADMGGDRRKTSHSIEVPLPQTPQHNSRKRPPSYAYECNSDQCKEDEMSECNAALILMKLHNSPNGDKWLGSSPGSSSSASWSSGSASPPLSDDGHAMHGPMMMLADDAASARIRTTSVSTSDEGIVLDFKEERNKKKVSVPDMRLMNEKWLQIISHRQSRRFRCTYPGCNFIELTQLKIERHIRNKHLGKKPRRSGDYDSCSDNEHEEEFYYTEDDDDDELVKTPSPASPPTLSHRDMARPPHEDPEYQRQIVGNFKQGRAANYFHHQQQQPQTNQQHHNNSNHSGKSVHHGNTHITSSQQQQLQNNNTSCIPTSPLAHHNYTWPSTAAVTVTATLSPTNGHHQQQQQQHHQQQPQQQQQQSPATLIKHARSSPRPSQSAAPYPSPTYVHHHHHNYSSSNSSSSSSSNNSSPIIHSNSSANNVLQQLSQQNVTVTAHHSGNQQQQQQSPHQQQQQLPIHQQQQQQQQQNHQMSAVTITPNYHPSPQQHARGQQHTTTASNIVANTQQQQQPHNHHQHHQQHMPLQHAAVQHAVNTAKHTPNSPNRRTRGENKKCRKVYGMDRRDQWCTQCRWKKACSRFGD